MYLMDISENIIRKVVIAKIIKLFFLKLILFLFLIIKNPQNNVIMGVFRCEFDYLHRWGESPYEWELKPFLGKE